MAANTNYHLRELASPTTICRTRSEEEQSYYDMAAGVVDNHLKRRMSLMGPYRPSAVTNHLAQPIPYRGVPITVHLTTNINSGRAAYQFELLGYRCKSEVEMLRFLDHYISVRLANPAMDPAAVLAAADNRNVADIMALYGVVAVQNGTYIFA